jgi:hypothetical protein
MNVDPTLVSFMAAAAAETVGSLSADSIKGLLTRVFWRRPDLQGRLERLSSPTDFEEALHEAAGELNALAGSGEIHVDGAFIEALGQAHFDHQRGVVRIGNSVVNAPILVTGGSGPGTTAIGDHSELRSKGTRITLQGNASIQMKGDANIKQS